jgi:hypothetical protein
MTMGRISIRPILVHRQAHSPTSGTTSTGKAGDEHLHDELGRPVPRTMEIKICSGQQGDELPDALGTESLSRRQCLLGREGALLSHDALCASDLL